MVDAIRDHIAAGNIRAQRHPDWPLTILNYAPQVQYGKLWDPATMTCRGLIVDDDWQVVARPFRKFFNWGEWDEAKQYSHLGLSHLIHEKLDGSLGILYQWDGEWSIATRGSFQSEQALQAQQMLGDYDLSGIPRGVTPLVEIIYPENRIVVDYGQRRELVFLDALDARGRSCAVEWEGSLAKPYAHFEFEQMMANPPSNHEGFVAVYADGERVKHKFEEYVRLHRILTGTNAVRVWEAMQDPSLRGVLLDRVPDEFYGWVSSVEAALSNQYEDIRQEATQDFEAALAAIPPHVAEDERERRKQFASVATTTKYPDILFSMLDGKPYEGNIWKRIKPRGDERPFREDES